jgi:hypothetical protein
MVDVAAHWAAQMSVRKEPPGRDGLSGREPRDRLSQLVLIHRTDDECPLDRLADLQGRALLLDIATGRVAGVEGNHMKPFGELVQLRATAGGSVARLVTRLAAEF